MKVQHMSTIIFRRTGPVWVHATRTDIHGHGAFSMYAHDLGQGEETDLTVSEAAKVAGCFGE